MRKTYLNYSGKSNVIFYEDEVNFLKVTFSNGTTYTYSINTVGAQYLAYMKNLAHNNFGLGTEISTKNTLAHKGYEPKGGNYVSGLVVNWNKCSISNISSIPKTKGIIVIGWNLNSYFPNFHCALVPDVQNEVTNFINSADYENLSDKNSISIFYIDNTNISVFNYINLCFNPRAVNNPIIICNLPDVLLPFKHRQ